MSNPLPTRGVPTLQPRLLHDWTRRYFAHPPSAATEGLDPRHVYDGTTIEYLARSREGLDGSLVALRNPPSRPADRSLLLWHGPHRLVEETFQGWFGARVQRLNAASLRVLVDRLDHFAVADPASAPTLVVPLDAFERLGMTVGALESVVDARVVVATQGLHVRAGYVPSLRVFVDWDGTRYGEGSRKLFYDAEGHPVSVENVAREALRRLAYDAVHPALFRRVFHALAGRPAAHFRPDSWPSSYARARISPQAWVQRVRDRLDAARERGFAAALEHAPGPWAQAQSRLAPVPEGGHPVAGRYLSRSRFIDLLTTLGDDRLHALLEGHLYGYEAAAADWFAWQPEGNRAFFCEVKSRGDHLRDTQKETILWCQRTGNLEYRLLEVLHGSAAPGT